MIDTKGTRVVTIGNQKGGVCKTTSALALGEALRLKGFSVLFVDCDPQADLTYTLNASQKGLTLKDVLEKKVPAAEVIQRTPAGDVIASCPDLASADKWLTDPRALRKALEPLRGQYDYVVIDTPRALAMLAIIAFAASDDIIITATADVYTLNAVTQLNDTVSLIREKINPSLRIAGILMCRQDARTIISRDIEEILRQQAKEKLGTKVFRTTIRQGKHVREAALLQRGLFDYAPGSNPAQDYMSFTEEYLEGGLTHGKEH